MQTVKPWSYAARQMVAPNDIPKSGSLMNGASSGLSALVTGVVTSQQALQLHQPVPALCLGLVTALLASISAANWTQFLKRLV
jgi:hypothetical protein